MGGLDLFGRLLLLRVVLGHGVRGQFREGHDRPHEDGDGEDHRAGLFHVLPDPLPGVQQHAAQGRQAVGRDFHDEGRAFALDHGGAQKLGHEQHEAPGREHHEEHGPGRVFREKRGHEHEVGGGFRAADHEGRGEDGGQAFARAAQGARAHDARHRAAARNAAGHDQRHDRHAVQAENPQHPVEHVGHARHVAEVLEEDQHGEHDADKRREADDRTHAAEDAVYEHRLHVAFGNVRRAHFAEPLEALLDPALRIRAQGEGDQEHAVEHGQHDQRPEQLVRDDLVDGVGIVASQLVAAAHHALLDEAVDEAVAPVGDDGVRGGGTVLAGDGLGLGAKGEQSRVGRAGLLALGHDLLVVLQVLDRQPARVITAGQEIRVLDGLGHALEDRVEVRAVGQAKRRPLALRPLGRFGHGLHELLAALAEPGHAGYHRHAEEL